jgi:C4-type Zn-finger protein
MRAKTTRSISCPKCGYQKDGAYYNIWSLEGGTECLKNTFPTGEANSMNFALFSTSGVHGTYTTIEGIEHSLKTYGENPSFLQDEDEDYPDDYHRHELTVAIYHPRIIGVGFGVIDVRLEDIPYLKKLRQSSWDAVMDIGRES